VLAPVALAGLLVACIAAAGSLDDVADEAPLAMLTMVLGLPLALTATMDRQAPRTRHVGAGMLVLALVLLLIVVGAVALLTQLRPGRIG